MRLVRLTHQQFWKSLLMYRKKYHDFSLVISHKKSYCVIACTDYPRCDTTITIFGQTPGTDYLFTAWAMFIIKFKWKIIIQICLLRFLILFSRREIENLISFSELYVLVCYNYYNDVMDCRSGDWNFNCRSFNLQIR